MRPISFALLCCAVACGPTGPQTKIDAVTVGWMDWPAEVNAGQPFRTRLIVSAVCALNPRLHAGASADLSAVTFAPFFEVNDDYIACVAGTSTSTLLASLGIDTAGTAPGLVAMTARSYDMRAAAWPFIGAAAQAIPIRTFGGVVVRPTGADQSRRNAGGAVYLQRDSLGCARIRPVGAWGLHAALVLEDQADTVGVSGAFVRGYIYDAAIPVCGETRVFHLVSRD